MVFLENPFLELESFYEKSNDIGCVGIQQVFPDYSFQASYGNFLSISEVLSKIFFLNKFSSKKVSKTRSVEYVDGAFMFISSKTFRELNGFDENFFFYFEDMDLCKRLVDRGYLNFILPNNKIIHERGYSTNKRGTLISEFSIKNFNSGIFIFIDLHFKSFLYKKLYLNLLKIQCLKQIIVHFFLGRKNSKFIIAKNKDLLIAINSR